MQPLRANTTDAFRTRVGAASLPVPGCVPPPIELVAPLLRGAPPPAGPTTGGRARTSRCRMGTRRSRWVRTSLSRPRLWRCAAWARHTAAGPDPQPPGPVRRQGRRWASGPTSHAVAGRTGSGPGARCPDRRRACPDPADCTPGRTSIPADVTATPAPAAAEPCPDRPSARVARHMRIRSQINEIATVRSRTEH